MRHLLFMYIFTPEAYPKRQAPDWNELSNHNSSYQIKPQAVLEPLTYCISGINFWAMGT